MKLNISRKTGYAFLLASAVVTLLGGILAWTGGDCTWLEFAALCLTAAAMLLLMLQKDADSALKGAYGFVLIILACSYVFADAVGFICAAAAWPTLLHIEFKRGASVERQMQIASAAEVLRLALLLAVFYGSMDTLQFWADLMWVPLGCLRGWAVAKLFKWQKEGV